MINAVVASAAVPAVFPYEVIGSYEFFDGGVDHMMDFDGAVERCREIVDSDDKIVIDTLMIAT